MITDFAMITSVLASFTNVLFLMRTASVSLDAVLQKQQPKTYWLKGGGGGGGDTAQ